MPKCSLCGGKVTEENRQYQKEEHIGEAYICQSCLADDRVDDRDDVRFSSKAQTEALDTAWKKGVERAKLSTGRFTRQAPVKILEELGYFIFCPLDRSEARLTFVMCKGRQEKERCIDVKVCEYKGRWK